MSDMTGLDWAISRIVELERNQKDDAETLKDAMYSINALRAAVAALEFSPSTASYQRSDSVSTQGNQHQTTYTTPQELLSAMRRILPQQSLLYLDGMLTELRMGSMQVLGCKCSIKTMVAPDSSTGQTTELLQLSLTFVPLTPSTPPPAP